MRSHPYLRRAPLLVAMLSLSFFPSDSRDRAVRGLEDTVDASIPPGDDFFAYANGAWLKAAVIPTGKDRWSVRDEINERARRQVAEILDGARTSSPDTLARKVADFRSALENARVIDARGIAPLTGIFSRIDGMNDRTDLARFLGATMRVDVDPLNFGV